MSVGLWVGCIAFSLMYPLTSYKGKLKSGFSWWISKASVLYTIALLQGLVMIALLHVFDGFTPLEVGKTLAFVCVASVDIYVNYVLLHKLTWKSRKFLNVGIYGNSAGRFSWYLPA